MKKVFNKAKGLFKYLAWLNEEKIKAMVHSGRGFN